MDFTAMLTRVIRAARLDVSLYNEVEADTSLDREALIVVVLAATLSGIGSFISGLLGASIGGALLGLVWGVIWGVIGYFIWAYLTWFIGTRLFGGTADPGELRRTLGYAYGPQALGILNAIPCVGWIGGLIGAIWSLVCGIIAVREALDTNTGNAVVTVIIGWLVIFVVGLLVSAFLGLGALGFGALTGNL